LASLMLRSAHLYFFPSTLLNYYYSATIKVGELILSIEGDCITLGMAEKVETVWKKHLLNEMRGQLS
jgi:demethoxyubiquinone hydroxylase (CLK1/Coq7/Cat5 family)